LLFVSVISASLAADAPNPKSISIAKIKHSGPVDFEKEILPILKNNCLACHNQSKPKGGLVLETPQTILKGGDTGPAVVAKKPLESLLLKAASHRDPDLIMPPPDNKVAAAPLKSHELGLLQLWIEQGAKGEVRSSVPIVWQPIPAGLNAIYAVALTRDGQFAACGRENQIFVYHLPSGRLVARLSDPQLQKSSNAGAAHRDIVNALAFSPDGELLASGSYREVKLWRHEKPATKSSANPKWLTAVITNKQLRVLDTNGVVVRSNAFPKALAELKGDSRLLFQVDDDEREVTFAKSEIEFRKSALKAAETNQSAMVARRNKAADTNAALAKIAGEKATALTNALTAQRDAGNAIHELGPEISKLVDAFSTAEKEFTNAMAQAKSTDAAHKSNVERLAADIETKSNALATAKAALESLPAETRTKHKLATDKLDGASKAVAGAEKESKKADEAQRAAKRELQFAEQVVQKAESALAETKSALTNAEETAKRAEKEFEATKQTLEKIRPPTTLAFSADDNALVTLDESGSAHYWNAETGVPFDAAWKAGWTLERAIGSGDANSPLADRVMALHFTPDGQQLVSGGGEPSRGGEIKIWRVPDGALVRDLPNVHSDSVFALDISADGKWLASGAADRFAKIVELSTGKVIKTFEGHTHHVLGVALKRDGRTLITAGADNVTKVWDAVAGERRKNIEGFSKEVTAAAFVGVDDQAILSAGDGQVVLVKSNGDKVRSFTGASDYVYGTAATPDAGIVIAGGGDGVLRAWNAKSGKLLAELRGSENLLRVAR
jgi:WD40 repeat protein